MPQGVVSYDDFDVISYDRYKELEISVSDKGVATILLKRYQTSRLRT